MVSKSKLTQSKKYGLKCFFPPKPLPRVKQKNVNIAERDMSFTWSPEMYLNTHYIAFPCHRWSSNTYRNQTFIKLVVTKVYWQIWNMFLCNHQDNL